MAKIKEVASYLESVAPLSLQEEYDNSGLLVGDPLRDVTGILVSLDCTEEVVNEAISKGCNMVVAHHPIVFRGLRRFTGGNYVERTIIKAIQNDIAIYAIHTNLDNVKHGVNARIIDKLGLNDPDILYPRSDLKKLVTFIPPASVNEVLKAMYSAGAGNIGNYEDCSFQLEGTGTYRPNAKASPHKGEPGKDEHAEEIRVEVLLPSHAEMAVLGALRASHPYEEVAYYLNSLDNTNQDAGAGMIASLEQEMSAGDFLMHIKESMDLQVIRHTPLIERPVRRVAVCGGSGAFLIKPAIRAGADVFITSDVKYHEFFDADGKMVIADIGHYESEVFTKDLLHGILLEKFTTFAVNLAETVTNPISYLR